MPAGAYNVVMDKRTMRETDLLAFEIAVKESEVGTVMGAYNRVNGVYCCENSYLLDDVLKKAWGFKGWVMSDWGAHAQHGELGPGRVRPGNAGRQFPRRAAQAAVEKGEVPMARLDDMVHRILRTEFALGVLDKAGHARAVNPFAGAEVAQARRRTGRSCCLKNAGGQLPLEAARAASIAVIGSHADVGVLSGGDRTRSIRPAATPWPGNPAHLASFLAAEGDSRQGGRTPRWRTIPARTSLRRQRLASASAVATLHQRSAGENLSKPTPCGRVVTSTAPAASGRSFCRHRSRTCCLPDNAELRQLVEDERLAPVAAVEETERPSSHPPAPSR